MTGLLNAFTRSFRFLFRHPWLTALFLAFPVIDNLEFAWLQRFPFYFVHVDYVDKVRWDFWASSIGPMIGLCWGPFFGSAFEQWYNPLFPLPKLTLLPLPGLSIVLGLLSPVAIAYWASRLARDPGPGDEDNVRGPFGTMGALTVLYVVYLSGAGLGTVILAKLEPLFAAGTWELNGIPVKWIVLASVAAMNIYVGAIALFIAALLVRRCLDSRKTWKECLRETFRHGPDLVLIGAVLYGVGSALPVALSACFQSSLHAAGVISPLSQSMLAFAAIGSVLEPRRVHSAILSLFRMVFRYPFRLLLFWIAAVVVHSAGGWLSAVFEVRLYFRLPFPTCILVDSVWSLTHAWTFFALAIFLQQTIRMHRDRETGETRGDSKEVKDR